MYIYIALMCALASSIDLNMRQSDDSCGGYEQLHVMRDSGLRCHTHW